MRLWCKKVNPQRYLHMRRRKTLAKLGSGTNILFPVHLCSFRRFLLGLVFAAVGFNGLLASNLGTSGDQPRNVTERYRQDPPRSRRIDVAKAALTDRNTTIDATSTVAFAISITGCNWHVVDAAAVHAYSIDVAQRQSSYLHRRYAFVHPNATSCSETLRKLGFIILVRDVPIRVSDIAKPYLRKAIEEDGCCGSKELLKLYAYTLNESVAVHLDTDMILLQSIDEVFDSILNGPERHRIATEGNKRLPSNPVNFLFTRDYTQGPKNRQDTSRWAVQGGLLVVKPNHTQFRSILDVVLEGNFDRRGWGGTGIGFSWGGAQIQGLLSYIYLNDPSAIELDRCVYNNMADDPTFSRGKYKGRCTTMKPNCSNCQLTPIDDIKMVHFTLCSKPWRCARHDDRNGQCARMLSKWFELRRQLESDWGRPFQPPPVHRWFYNASMGYCKATRSHSKRYSGVRLPEDLNWSSLPSLPKEGTPRNSVD